MKQVTGFGCAAAVSLLSFSCGGTAAPTRPLPLAPASAISVATSAWQAPVVTSWICLTRNASGTPGIFTSALEASCPVRSRLTAFAAALAAPSAPSNLTATVNARTVTLTWVAPISPDPASSYVVEASLDASFGALVAVFDTLDTATVFTATDVPPGTYYVRVRARNSAGTSAATPRAVADVVGGPCSGPPRPPAALRFTRVGTQLIMEWDAASGANEYIIEAGSVTNGKDLYVGSAGLSTTFTAIVPESTHAYVRVYARNACGTSLRGDEIEIGALWSVSFPAGAGLNANACVPDIAPGGLCSQVVQLRTLGQFEETWSPGTPVMRVNGVMTATQFSATVTCLNGAASGTLQATWNGERYVGTGTLGGSTSSMRVTPGNYDPDCLTR